MRGNLVYYITVEGVVPGPQGSKTPTRFGGMRESSKKVKPWRAAVHKEAVAALPEGWEALDGPLKLEVEFHLPRPKSAPKTIDIPAIRYPDTSKLVRSTEDALTTAGVWADDARVVRLEATKRYTVGPDLPRIYDRSLHRPIGASIKVYRA